MADRPTPPEDGRTDRPDADAQEAASTVVIRTADGDLVAAGELANEWAMGAGAVEPPDQTVVATGELYKPK